MLSLNNVLVFYFRCEGRPTSLSIPLRSPYTRTYILVYVISVSTGSDALPSVVTLRAQSFMGYTLSLSLLEEIRHKPEIFFQTLIAIEYL